MQVSLRHLCSAVLLAAGAAWPIAGQQTPGWRMAYGAHAVGYRTLCDTAGRAAPARERLQVWYPARRSQRPPMRYADYIAPRRGGECEPSVSDSSRVALLNAFARFIAPMAGPGGEPVGGRLFAGDSAPFIARQLAAKATRAFRDAEPVPARFPVVVYFTKGTFEQSDLLATLASHGYVVATFPFEGFPMRLARPPAASTAERHLSGAREIGRAIDALAALPQADTSRVILMASGADQGVAAAIWYQVQTSRLKALVTYGGRFPGAQRVQSGTGIQPLPPLQPTASDSVPAVVFRRWTIPVLDFDDNHGQFTRGILDSLRHAERIRVAQHVGHPNAEGIRRLVYSDTVASTANDVVGAYVLQFIDYALHGRAAASAFLDRSPEDHGIPQDLISIRRERGEDASPGPRSGALMIYDAARAQTLLFGGMAPSGSGPGTIYPNDLWAWNGSTWRRLEPPAGTPRPAGREVPHLVYDAARQRVVMFGGRRRPEILSDTWEWDGTRWHELTDTGFETVTHAATVFNPARGRVMMFGGGRVAPASGMSRTLWEWDGRRWTAVDTAGPANTLGMEIAVKPGGEVILLARGPFQNAAPVSRAWTWNGSWREAEVGPVIANLQAMTGTPDGTMYIYRSWERWLTSPIMIRRDPNGVWTQLSSDTGPGLRYTEAAAWDSVRGRMVIYGGTNTRGSYLSDTWEFDGRNWIHR